MGLGPPLKEPPGKGEAALLATRDTWRVGGGRVVRTGERQGRMVGRKWTAFRQRSTAGEVLALGWIATRPRPLLAARGSHEPGQERGPVLQEGSTKVWALRELGNGPPRSEPGKDLLDNRKGAFWAC
jgi:hypothetical protein